MKSKDLFIVGKQKQLSKSDKSNIGEWDKPIVPLCNKINRTKNYYTTSSCSGRIVLLKASDKKMENAFLFRTHSKVNYKEFMKAISSIEYDGLVEFQQTSCIMHVACRTISDALDLVNKAKIAGWKRSGVMSGTYSHTPSLPPAHDESDKNKSVSNSRFMIELHSTESMSFPIMENKKLLVSEEYIRRIIDIANSKLDRVWEKIDRLKKTI